MLLARGHDARHTALIFEDGICFLCGRMLEPELGEGACTDGVDRLLAKVKLTRLRMEQEAAARGISWDDYCAQWAVTNPNGET